MHLNFWTSDLLYAPRTGCLRHHVLVLLTDTLDTASATGDRASIAASVTSGMYEKSWNDDVPINIAT